MFVVSLTIKSMIRDDYKNIIEMASNNKLVSLKTKTSFTPNMKFVINNNLAQYSSYLIIDQDEKSGKEIYKVEALVHFQYKYVKDFSGKENFICVLKLLSYGDRKEELVYELEAFDSPKFYFNENKKLIYNLDLNLFKSLNASDPYFLLQHIIVAIIWKFDFNKSLDINNFLILNDSLNILPYSLIKFQIPTIIQSRIPRLKTVGFCVHYIYKIQPQVKQWIDLHLLFGVKEIMIYDAVENRSLTRFVKNIYKDDDRITVNAFDISLNDLCNETILFDQFEGLNISRKLKDYMKKSCKEVYDLEFRERFHWRGQHEQLTVNDCFTVMKQKYEFIGYYDLDEFVFPRTIENIKYFNIKMNYYTCNSFSRICSNKPFENKFKSYDVNFFYNYLQSLIEKNKFGRDLNKLGQISFSHAAYLKPDQFEKQLIYDLGAVIENIQLNYSSLNAYSIFLSSPPFNEGHRFNILIEDMDYIKYLFKSYNSLVPCVYRSFLKNLTSVNQNLIRYLYYITEGNERMGKAIYYYKNVKSLFVHYAEDVVKDHWSFHAPEFDGNILSHFREDISQIYSLSHKGTIRKLNIDYEYIFFLLKSYTLFCEI